MSQITFNFSTTSSSVTGYSPLAISFTPSAISLAGNEFLSKVVYQLPDRTVTLTNNFTSTVNSADCRAGFNYTLPAGLTTQILTVTAYKGPAYTSTVYTISATNVLPFLTTNPRIASPSPYTFGEVHLLRSRAWGTENTQMLLLETNNPNYLLINYNG